MDLIQLKMFCTVATSGSLARAAQHLNRVPSNLTTRLRQLEEELGVDLFIREKQRLRLSPMGYNFLGYAEKILALSEEALTIAQSGEPGGQFLLGVTESANASFLPALMAEFHARYPQIRLTLTTAHREALLAQVSAGTLAAALVDGPVEEHTLTSCIALTQRGILISAKDCAAPIKPAALSGVTRFTLSEHCPFRTCFEGWLADSGVRAGPVVTVSSYQAMLTCVASGGGVAMLPEDVFAQLGGKHAVHYHVLPGRAAEAHCRLAWRRDGFTANIEVLKYLIISRVANPLSY